MAHSLLHQILVSDLVVPIALAQTPDQRILPRFGARLAAGTWLRGDVVVVDRARLPAEGWFIDGPPLLVAEVTSDASARADLGPKKEMWARSGVPSPLADRRGEGRALGRLPGLLRRLGRTRRRDRAACLSRPRHPAGPGAGRAGHAVRAAG